jgi:hypothetical protein
MLWCNFAGLNLKTMIKNPLTRLKQHEIEIKFFDRGCVVRVGCKRFAFESVEKAMAELVAYTKDPIEVGNKYQQEEDFEPMQCNGPGKSCK